MSADVATLRSQVLELFQQLFNDFSDCPKFVKYLQREYVDKLGAHHRQCMSDHILQLLLSLALITFDGSLM